MSQDYAASPAQGGWQVGFLGSLGPHRALDSISSFLTMSQNSVKRCSIFLSGFCDTQRKQPLRAMVVVSCSAGEGPENIFRISAGRADLAAKYIHDQR